MLQSIVRVFFSLLLFLGYAFGEGSSAAAYSLPDGLRERKLEVSGSTRHYLEYVPSAVRDKPPLVILLHGGGQSMRKIFRNNRTDTRRWLDLAGRDGFVLVAPNGTNPGDGDTSGNRQHWNDLREDGAINDFDADDAGFILALIDEMVKVHGVDPSRIYVTGASNGGMMTYRLLAEHPLRFAAGAAFIANLPEAHVARPSHATPILICNGTLDPLVPYAGGTVWRNRGHVRSTVATVAFWTEVNGVKSAAETVYEMPDRDAGDGSRLEVSGFADPDGTVRVLVIQVEGGGHYVPSSSAGEPGPLVRRFLGESRNRDAEGADLAWEFMRRFNR